MVRESRELLLRECFHITVSEARQAGFKNVDSTNFRQQLLVPKNSDWLPGFISSRSQFGGVDPSFCKIPDSVACVKSKEESIKSLISASKKTAKATGSKSKIKKVRGRDRAEGWMGNGYCCLQGYSHSSALLNTAIIHENMLLT